MRVRAYGAEAGIGAQWDMMISRARISWLVTISFTKEL